MRTRLESLAVLVTLLTATALSAGCAATSAEEESPEVATDALTKALDKTASVSITGAEGEDAHAIGAPGKIKNLLAAVRLGATVPAGTLPRCPLPSTMRFLDAKGAEIGVARYGGGCGILVTPRATRLFEIDQRVLGALLAAPAAVGDFIWGIDAISSYPDNETFSDPELMKVLLDALDLNQQPAAPSATSACPASELIGGFRFMRQGKVAAIVEPNMECELSPGSRPAALKSASGDVIGIIRMTFPQDL
jgi:hypothetical protein